MKHLLIILSFLLIQSPVVGESKTIETLYEWKTPSGIQWREIGDKDFHAKYKGDVVIGRPHGVGTLVYPDGNKYVGEFMNGLFHGQGKYNGPGTETLSNGWKYVGEWREGKPWNIKIYGKTGIIIMKYVNGVEHK